MIVVGAGLAFGALTSYAQGWLPHAVGPLANSSGAWALIAFALALLAADRRGAALAGATALAALLAGYVIASELRSYTASLQLILFWGAAALFVGPPIGVAASWVRTERGVLAALGAGALAGVLVGEGVYGLVSIADTTSRRYWWCEIALGVLLVGALAGRARWHVRVTAEALAVALLTATLFFVVYRQDLITVLH